jgi:hypothetical protein
LKSELFARYPLCVPSLTISRTHLILTQVKIKLNEGDLPTGGKVYQKLKRLAPLGDEVIEGRELIKAAVIKRKRPNSPFAPPK